MELLHEARGKRKEEQAWGGVGWVECMLQHRQGREQQCGASGRTARRSG